MSTDLNDGDDFDDFLNSRLDEEQSKELDNLLDEVETTTTTQTQTTTPLTTQTTQTLQKEEIIEEEVKTPTNEKPKINRKLKTKEIKKINNIIENDNQITIEFPNILNELKEEDLSLDEIQNQKITRLLNSSIDTDEFIKKRFEKMIQATSLKFGKLVKIDNLEKEIKRKFETFTNEEKETFNFLNLSLQEKLITLEKFFEVLNASLEKSIRKQISIKSDKKKLREMYFEKEKYLKDMQEKYLKLDEDYILMETKMTNENNKLKRERDLLLSKLSKYETVDEKLIEQEATPLTESVSTSIQNWFSGWKKEEIEQKSNDVDEEKVEKKQQEKETSVFKFW
eukprot:gene10392-2921_t